MRGGWADEPIQVAHVERVGEYLRGTFAPLDPNILPPGECKIWPTVADLSEFNQLITDPWYGLSIDLENAGQYITLVGITLFDPDTTKVGPSLSLPFKLRGGKDYWRTWEDHVDATGYLYKWLADTRTAKLFHNGVNSDIPDLEATGFVVRGPIWDSMVMVHYTYPESRKGLQWNATLHLGSPAWKPLLGIDDQEEGKE
jgi:hypothetical protein